MEGGGGGTEILEDPDGGMQGSWRGAGAERFARNMAFPAALLRRAVAAREVGAWILVGGVGLLLDDDRGCDCWVASAFAEVMMLFLWRGDDV